ncbi:MAG TPA: hypothetical protein VHB21_15180 [Minicystis sp.]|nr:hypothetical protein [Minicystis sp.]
MTDMHALLPPDRLGLLASVAVVYGLVVLAPAVAICVALLRAAELEKRARRAEAELARKTELVEGHAAISGVVQTEDGGDIAVEVAIEQVGRELPSNNGPRHRWTEASRTVSARPFSLVLDRGERVRVDADDEVRLFDALDGAVVEKKGRRLRTESLMNGERAFAVGVLKQTRDETGAGAGYRGGGHGWALSRPRREHLMLSLKPFDGVFRRRARAHVRTAVVLAIAMVAANAAFYRFHALNLWGETLAATHLRATATKHDIKKPFVTSYLLAGEVSLGGRSVPVADDVSVTLYYNVAAYQAVGAVPFVVWPSHPEIAMVGEPSIDLAQLLLLLWAYVAGAASFFIIRARTRPWYEQKKVVETFPGRLP